MKIDEVATVDVEVSLYLCVLKDAQGNTTVDYTNSELVHVTLLGFDGDGAIQTFDGSHEDLVEWARSHGMKAVVQEVTHNIPI